MKKMSILIAVLAVISAASAARAEVAGFNFDAAASGAEGALSRDAAFDSSAALPEPELRPVFPELQPYIPSLDCSIVCFNGMNSDCSCKDPWQEVWQQAGGSNTFGCQGMDLNSWYGMVKCSQDDSVMANARGLARSGNARPRLDPALQKKLRGILLGYCDTYPEFAEVIMPALKDADAKILAREGFVYVVSGNSIIRFGGKTPVEADKRIELPGWLGPAADAAGAVYGAINAWNEYHSYPPVQDSGEADHYHGPALTVDPNDSDLHSYHSGNSEE